MADYTTNLDTILTNQAGKEVLVNQLIDAASPSMLYGRHGSACVGLTWAYYGGTFFLPDGSIAEIANGTLTLAASDTNYIEVNPATGAISVNTSGFTAGRTKIYTVITGVGAVTDYDDHRSFNILPPGTLAQIADSRILANISGGLSSPVATTLSALLDYILGNDQGSIIFRNATAWTLLAPGVSGRFLKTGGAGADPSWDTVAGASGGDVVGPASAVDGHFVQFDLATGKLVKDGGLSFDIDGTLSANSDSRIPSQKAVKSYVDNAIDGAVVGPASATAGAVALFDGTSGKLIKVGTLTDVLDLVGSAAQGDILYRSASGWVRLAAGTDGQLLRTKGASANPQWDSQPFDVHAFYPGVPTASAKVLRIPVARAVSLPANFSGSYAKASANATGSTAFDVQKNGSSIGTITFAAGASSATFTTASGAAQSLAAGDVLSIIAPATPDATLADVGIVLAGTR